MRKKERKLLVTFHTTTDAMAFEQVCKERNVPGRLIPVPREITAGCGMAWCAELAMRDAVVFLIKEIGLKEEAIHECMV